MTKREIVDQLAEIRKLLLRRGEKPARDAIAEAVWHLMGSIRRDIEAAEPAFVPAPMPEEQKAALADFLRRSAPATSDDLAALAARVDELSRQVAEQACQIASMRRDEVRAYCGRTRYEVHPGGVVPVRCELPYEGP